MYPSWLLAHEFVTWPRTLPLLRGHFLNQHRNQLLSNLLRSSTYRCIRIIFLRFSDNRLIINTFFSLKIISTKLLSFYRNCSRLVIKKIIIIKIKVRACSFTEPIVIPRSRLRFNRKINQNFLILNFIFSFFFYFVPQKFFLNSIFFFPPSALLSFSQ